MDHRDEFNALRATHKKTREQETQDHIDRFYAAHGPCCAGCDWWRWHNAMRGECHRSAPVAGEKRVGLSGIYGLSMSVPAGHIFTPRSHVCGDFQDTPEQGQ